MSTDSRLDAILEQLNALGGSTTESRPPTPPQRMLRSVPDLEPETFDDVVDQPIEPPVLEPIAPPPVPQAIEPPPAPVEPVEPANFTFGAPDEPVAVAERLPEVEPLPVAEPMPVVVEYQQPEPPEPEPELTPEPEPETPAIPTMFTPPAIPVPVPEAEPQVEEQELVFELDGPLDVDAQGRDLEAPPVPDASVTDLPATPPPLPDSGWVSHHHEPVDVPSEAADNTLAPVEPFESTDTPVSEAAPEANTFDAPRWGEINEDPEVRGEQSNASPFSPLVAESTTSESFETDDELPLPDFTGVWEDTTEPTVWDADTDLDGESLPDPVEIASSGSGISVGRNELDSLRPVEEEPKAEAKAEQRLGRKLQLFAVILFGLIALAVVLLNDPAVVEDLREIYDGFFG